MFKDTLVAFKDMLVVFEASLMALEPINFQFLIT